MDDGDVAEDGGRGGRWCSGRGRRGHGGWRQGLRTTVAQLPWTSGPRRTEAGVAEAGTAEDGGGGHRGWWRSGHGLKLPLEYIEDFLVICSGFCR
jgi:hypothetical protein